MNIKKTTQNFIKHPVLKNNLLFTGASYFFRIFNSLIIFSLAARIFSVSEFGLISLFVLIITVIYTVIDFGHRILIVRDISKDPLKLKGDYLGNKLIVKLPIFIFLSIGILWYATTKDFWGFGLFIIFVMLIAGVTKGMTNFYFAVFQGLELFRLETLCLGVLSGLNLIVISFCFFYPTIPAFILGYTVAAIFQLVLTHYFALKNIPNFQSNFLFEKINLGKLINRALD